MTDCTRDETTRKRTAARAAALFLLLLPLALAGCRHTGGRDRIEGELRSRENELRETREELDRAQAINDALERQIHGSCQAHAAKIPPEVCATTAGVKEIALGRQTGGYDDDRCPGDEALQVVLEPRDADNHAIKANGTLRVTALEITPQGIKRPLDSWEVCNNQLRQTWRSGLLSTGYFVILPWKNWPTTEKIRVVAQFVLQDGRVFEADKDVTVRLAARPPHVIEMGPQLPPSDALPPPLQSNAGGRSRSSIALPIRITSCAPPRAPASTGTLLDGIHLERPEALDR